MNYLDTLSQIMIKLIYYSYSQNSNYTIFQITLFLLFIYEFLCFEYNLFLYFIQ